MVDLKKLAGVDIVALTIIGEARGEPIEGQVAVGCVIRNRLTTYPKKYASYHDVCLEPMQFSCWNTKDPNRVLLEELADDLLSLHPFKPIYLKQCNWVAQGIVDWTIMDNVNGSRFYMTKSLFNTSRPSWAQHAFNTTELHNHLFFNV